MNEWRDIRGYEGHYQVSNDGQVRSLKRGPRLMSQARSRGDYRQVNLYLYGRVKHFYVHRLVADAFLGPIPDGMEVNHKDGDKDNNCVANLEIVTSEANLRHARETGLVPDGRGEASHMAKLTEREVREIRLARARKEKVAAVAGRYGVCERTIYAIWEKRTWRHVA
jgi:hypothetical protein